MLLQLTRFRPARTDIDRAARPYSRYRKVRWELNIDTRTGAAAVVDLADSSQAATKSGREVLVPNVGRSSGIAPCLGVDDLQYVLGWTDAKSKPARVEVVHAAFVQLCRRWQQAHPDEHLAAALVAFYDLGRLPQPSPGLKWTSKDLVLIVVDGREAIDCDSLWSLWETIVQERKTGTAKGGGRHGICLVCGKPGSLLDRMPQALPQTLVPGAEQEVALVSANRRIHTFDFTEGLSNSPICVGCGQAAVANLHTILSHDTYTFSYPGQRTRMAWWITDGADSQTIRLLDRNPTAIRDYLRSAAEGRRRRRPPSSHEFCSMTVSGNVARLVVHHWLEMPLDQAEEHVDAWFQDMCIVGRGQTEPTGFPIWLLALCAGQWLPSDNSGKGRYIPMGAKAADRPGDLAHTLLHSALHNGTLGPQLLGHIVRRIRTDLHIDGPRVAMLRVALNRHPHRIGEGPTAVLDEKQDHPAYLYGRLFAVLESLQRRAYGGGDDMPNATFFHRYFAGAVANPRIAHLQGVQMYPAWLKKLENAGKSDNNQPEAQTHAEKARRAAYAFRKRLHSLHERLDRPAQPLTDTESQSWFVLGYFHQQAHDIRMAKAGKAPEIPAEAFISDTDDEGVQRA